MKYEISNILYQKSRKKKKIIYINKFNIYLLIYI